MPLTDIQLRNLKPGKRIERKSDGGGLYIESKRNARPMPTNGNALCPGFATLSVASILGDLSRDISHVPQKVLRNEFNKERIAGGMGKSNTSL